MDNTEGNFDEKVLAYDLRQRYAKLAGDHLEIVSLYRRERNYPEYFRALEDLHTVIAHKFKANSNKDDRDKYSKLRTNAINKANEHTSAWLGNGSNNQEVAEIEESLRAIERFLYEMMDEAHMFGTGFSDDEGL
jgi:hypothetical protein